MKKFSSVVWRFFDRVENENKRCFAVLCKLCDTQYKFFGNTTNLRSHLINKHPLQWELSQNNSFDESTFHVDDDESNQSAAAPKRRKHSKGYKDKNVDVLDTSGLENDQQDTEDNEATFNLVRQLHDTGASDEEWLEEDPYTTTHVETYETKPKRQYRKKIKREIQTPPRRVSTFTPHMSFEKQSPIIIEQANLKDEYSVFGEYVANKLRKFKAPRTRGNLQQLITTILWQAEYGTYDNADTVKRVLMFTTHEADQMQEIETHGQLHTETIIEQRDDEPNQSVDADCLTAQ